MAACRTSLAGLSAVAALLAGQAAPVVAAGEALWSLQRSVQACIESSQAAPCRQAEAQVGALVRNPSYLRSSHLCKEEIYELGQVVALLPLRDAIPAEVMASAADVLQACQPYGF